MTVHVKDYGRYARPVAEIILPDSCGLKEEMVRTGLAWSYRQYAWRGL
jgi:endonuclease YncB( thermonuclease family)